MQIRVCTVEDFRSLYFLNQSVLGYEYDLDKTMERLSFILNRKTDKIFVACIDKKVVGYVHGSDYECTYSDSLKNVMAIAVMKDYQGKGIGRALLGAIEDWAKESCSGVRLVSGFNRTNAHHFYTRCGYTMRKNQKNFIKYLL